MSEPQNPKNPEQQPPATSNSLPTSQASDTSPASQGKNQTSQAAVPPKGQAGKSAPALASTMRLSNQDKMALAQGQKAPKSAAAARIMERIDKSKSEPVAKTELADETKRRPTPDETKRRPIEPTPIQPPAPPKIQEITLSGEMAQIGQAWQQKLVNEAALVQTMLTQAKLERDGQKKGLLELLQEQNFLKKDDAAHLQNVTTTKLQYPSGLPRTSPFDLMVGQKLMEEKLLSREDTQRMLRVQTSLVKLSIVRSLDSLILDAKLMAADILKPFVDQLRKQVETKKKESETIQESDQAVRNRQAMRSGPASKVNLLPLVGGGILGGCIFLATLYFLTPPPKEKPVSKIPPEVAANQALMFPGKQPQPTVTSETPKPVPVLSRPVTEPMSEAELAKQMESRGFAQWGKHWILAGQKQLLAQRWEAGDKPKDVPFALVSSQVRYFQGEDNSYSLSVQGQLDVPTLAPGMSLKLELQLFHAFPNSKVYAQSAAKTNEEHSFQAVLKGLPKPLATGLYVLRLSLAPDAQSDFIRDFLTIQEPRQWLIPFTLGDKIRTEKYLKQRQNQLDEIRKSLLDAGQKLQQFGQKDPKTARREWSKWAADWQGKMAALAQKINDLQNQKLLPVFPEAEGRLTQLWESLQNIYQAWETWQRDFAAAKFPEVQEKHLELEIQLDSWRLSLKKEEKQWANILQESKATMALDETNDN